MVAKAPSKTLLDLFREVYGDLHEPVPTEHDLMRQEVAEALFPEEVASRKKDKEISLYGKSILDLLPKDPNWVGEGTPVPFKLTRKPYKRRKGNK